MENGLDQSPPEARLCQVRGFPVTDLRDMTFLAEQPTLKPSLPATEESVFYLALGTIALGTNEPVTVRCRARSVALVWKRY